MIYLILGVYGVCLQNWCFCEDKIISKSKWIYCTVVKNEIPELFHPKQRCCPQPLCYTVTPHSPHIAALTTLKLRLPSSSCPLSVHEGCEPGSPPRPWCSDGRLSRSCSSENQHTSALGGGCGGGGGADWPKKEAEENKENVRLDQCFSNTSGLPTDLDGWNESVISGGSL